MMTEYCSHCPLRYFNDTDRLDDILFPILVQSVDNHACDHNDSINDGNQFNKR